MALSINYDFELLWDYSQPGQSEAKFRKFLPQIPEDEPVYLELLTQIARAEGLQQKFDAAHQTLDLVEKRLGEATSRPKIRYLLERGRVLNSSNHSEQARPFFEQALNIAKQASEDSYAVDAVHMLAIISPPAQSLTLNLQAIEMAENSGQEKARAWLGSLYNNTGWALHDLGKYEAALEIFQKAEAWRRLQGSAKETRIAVWCVARTLRSLQRIEEALAKQVALKEEFESAGEESDGYVFEEIGECLAALDRLKEARPFFARAYEILSQDIWLTKQEPARLDRLKELGTGK